MRACGGHMRSCERDMAWLHVLSRYIWKPGTNGCYPALPDTTRYYRQANLRAIAGISSDLQLSVVYV
eukprot:834046-Amorphochlora_amoeboformis.AAC.1